MTTYVLRNNQSAIDTGNTWTGASLQFAGASALNEPLATFTGPDTLAGIVDTGSAAQPGYGAISLLPGGTLTTNALKIAAATLSISERPGASVTFNGASTVSNGATLTATGYSGAGTYTVNGTMAIDGTSTVNMDYVAVHGTGTFHLIGEGALLRLGSVGAGNTVLLDGGMLSLTNGMSFLGTIADSAPTSSRIGPMASVDIYNAMTAASETFDRSTGLLSLFDASGNQVAHLHFAGTGDLYATPTAGLATNYIAITAHPSAGALPVTFSG